MGTTFIEPNARVASFLCYLSRKVFVCACIATGCLIALAVSRKVLSGEYEVLLDNLMVGCSFVFLCIFGFRLIKAWFKSGSKEVRLTQEKLVYCAIGGFFILIAGALCFVVIYMYLIKLKYPSLEQRGVFGDSFGALNSIVSTVALIGLWLTVWLQFRQTQEDRKRGLEHDEIERKWREEELLNQRRSFWPVLLLSHVSGEIGPVSFNADGAVVLNVKVNFEYKNISDVPLFNVAMITDYQGVINQSGFSRAEGPIVPYVEDDASDVSRNMNRLQLSFMETAISKIKIADAFVRGKERIVNVRILFSTAQGFCYCLYESLHVCLANQMDIAKIKDLDDAVEMAFNVDSKKARNIGQKRMQILEGRGFSLAYNIQLAFEAQPLQHEIREISKQEYHDIIATCPFPVIKGGV